MKNILVLLTAICLLSISQVNAQIPTSGLVAHFKFDGNTTDASPTANNGTINGGVTLTTDRFGAANKAYQFNGSTGYISVPHNAAYNVSSYAISVWFKNSGAPSHSHGALITKNSTNQGFQDPFTIYVFNRVSVGISKAQARSGFGSGEVYTPQSTDNADNGSWHHVVAVFNNAADLFTLYYDGLSMGSTSTTINPITNSTQIEIGRWAGNGFYFNGAIDDLRIYNTAYGSTEVAALYQDGGSIPTLSEWGLILLSLLSLAVLAAVAFMVNTQRALVPAGVSAGAIPAAFVRSMPLNTKLLATVLMYLLPLAVAGFIVVHYLSGTNGALDFTGTLVSAVIVGYIVHLIVGKSKV